VKGEQDDDEKADISQYYAIIELEKPILCPSYSLLIASKLDKDITKKECRLAFQG